MATPGVQEVVARLQAVLGEFEAQADPRRFFCGTYLRVTEAVASELAANGFRDAPWMDRWDAVFAALYLDALDRDREGLEVPQPWASAFAACDGDDVDPVRHVLLGMNAHINYDLPLSVLAVMPPAEFADPAVAALRRADHEHVDTVLLRRLEAEGDELARDVTVGWTARLLAPVSGWAAARLLWESRRKVWRNTELLDRARRRSRADLQARVAELDRLTSARVPELRGVPQVLLYLGLTGFGVRLHEEGGDGYEPPLPGAGSGWTR